ncbi:MAG: UDP-N-acetylmuramoyl-L-alanine--D-glutamate ligase [Bacteroidales bacterium]|nr:UDP-N-acetylmuramoyl-L-alanine--D-glutamate ligase [Bacteroidales bacterium]
MEYLSIIEKLLRGKKIAIAGFGREGRSSCQFLLKYFPEFPFAVFDSNENISNDSFFKNNPQIRVHCGPDYLKSIYEYNFIIKSPGIQGKTLGALPNGVIISSQTDLFLSCFSKQIIGITGTKGKSTTTTLLYKIFENAGKNVIIVGNIGIPPFDRIEAIKPDTHIIYELSSHQLENVTHAPHIAIMLNIFQEHLDHYDSYKDYQLAKFNIARFQQKDDYFIYNSDLDLIINRLHEVQPKSNLLPFSLVKDIKFGCSISLDCIILRGIGNTPIYFDKSLERQLQGDHNLSNMLAVITACKIKGIENVFILNTIAAFKGLEHRQEYIGCFHGKHFYNDSIATIPEATIAALKTLKDVDTLILGGYDRGIDYQELVDYLLDSEIQNLVLLGNAGERIYKMFYKQASMNIYYYRFFDEGINKAKEVTPKNKICLLSPAAASYGMFKDFEERGKRFKELLHL